MPSATEPKLRIAVIGTGPGGLSAAIALSELPNVELRVYEKANELKAIGAGISINHNGWRVLELLKAREGIVGASTVPTVQRNAYTAEIVDPGISEPSSEYEARRVRRVCLQKGLAARVPEGIMEFNKKLVSIQNLEDSGVRLVFADGSETTTDLLIGADGIRSVVRQNIVPDFDLHYSGQVGWRVLLPVKAFAQNPDFPLRTTNYWHAAGKMVFTCPVDKLSELEYIEVSCRVFNEPEIIGETVSWARPAPNEKVSSRFNDLDPMLVKAIEQVPEGDWVELASYAGPALASSIAWDKVVLIGDASHPSAGGFGSGSAFAMEDSWVLARAIEHAGATRSSLAEALRIFNEIRMPYYKRMFDFREGQKGNIQKLAQTEYDDFDSRLRERMTSDGIGAKRSKSFLGWVYDSNIGQIWEEYVKSEKAKDV